MHSEASARSSALRDPSANARRDGLLAEAAKSETPDPALCVKLARATFALGDAVGAYEWLLRSADSHGPYLAWSAAASALSKFEAHTVPPSRRSVRVAIAGSYTTSQ